MFLCGNAVLCRVVLGDGLLMVFGSFFFVHFSDQRSTNLDPSLKGMDIDGVRTTPIMRRF